MDIKNFIISRDDIMSKAAGIEAAYSDLNIKYKFDVEKIKTDKNYFAVKALTDAKATGTNIEFLGVNMTIVSPESSEKAKMLEKWLCHFDIRYTTYI